MDVDFSINHAEFPHPPPDSSRSSSRRSSTNSERLFQIDNKSIPRKPGSARYRVLPNIIADECSDVDKNQEIAETGVAQRDVSKKDVTVPKEIGENERQRRMQGKKEESQGKAVPEEGTRNKGQYSLKGSTAAVRETKLVKKSQQIGNLSQRTGDDKLAKEINDKMTKPVKGIGSKAQDGKERKSPVKRIALKEPGQDERQITLAVKLPTGERLQRNFRPSDPLQVILKFAESSSRCNFTGCELVCLEPRLVLRNMRKTICQSNLSTKTLLYIQLPEPK